MAVRGYAVAKACLPEGDRRQLGGPKHLTGKGSLAVRCCPALARRVRSATRRPGTPDGQGLARRSLLSGTRPEGLDLPRVGSERQTGKGSRVVRCCPALVPKGSIGHVQARNTRRARARALFVAVRHLSRRVRSATGRPGPPDGQGLARCWLLSEAMSKGSICRALRSHTFDRAPLAASIARRLLSSGVDRPLLETWQNPGMPRRRRSAGWGPTARRREAADGGASDRCRESGVCRRSSEGRSRGRWGWTPPRQPPPCPAVSPPPCRAVSVPGREAAEPRGERARP
jgi:hypothetical protein